ncbi:MAG TPA: transposase, partial [Thermoanaerobaculia bacterium]
MVLNPRIARRFAEALAQRSKTDPVDARALREYARRMEFVPWSPPASERLRLRALARRIAALVEMRTQEKNRLHAAQSSAEMKCITHDIEVSIRHFDRRIKALEKQAKILIDRHPQLQAPIARIISVKGIAFRSAIQVYGELCVLPKDMTARQWVAHAGLDPRHFESGAFQGKTRISKAGNK